MHRQLSAPVDDTPTTPITSRGDLPAHAGGGCTPIHPLRSKSPALQRQSSVPLAAYAPMFAHAGLYAHEVAGAAAFDAQHAEHIDMSAFEAGDASQHSGASDAQVLFSSPPPAAAAEGLVFERTLQSLDASSPTYTAFASSELPPASDHRLLHSNAAHTFTATRPRERPSATMSHSQAPELEPRVHGDLERYDPTQHQAPISPAADLADGTFAARNMDTRHMDSSPNQAHQHTDTRFNTHDHPAAIQLDANNSHHISDEYDSAQPSTDPSPIPAAAATAAALPRARAPSQTEILWQALQISENDVPSDNDDVTTGTPGDGHVPAGKHDMNHQVRVNNHSAQYMAAKGSNKESDGCSLSASSEMLVDSLSSASLESFDTMLTAK